MGCKQFPSDGNRESPLSFYPGQGLHRRSCAIWRSVLGAKPFRGWSKLLCDTPSVDLSRDRTALSGKFPEDALKAGRELEFRILLNSDAIELEEELPPGKIRL